jgi:hypothetical protein
MIFTPFCNYYCQAPPGSCRGTQSLTSTFGVRMTKAFPSALLVSRPRLHHYQHVAGAARAAFFYSKTREAYPDSPRPLCSSLPERHDCTKQRPTVKTSRDRQVCDRGHENLLCTVPFSYQWRV